jgi:hypothetical protein
MPVKQKAHRRLISGGFRSGIASANVQELNPPLWATAQMAKRRFIEQMLASSRLAVTA